MRTEDCGLALHAGADITVKAFHDKLSDVAVQSAGVGREWL